MNKRIIEVKYNTNSQAYTAVISDSQGKMLGLGYGNSKAHALKVAKLDANGRLDSDGRVAKISVCI
jgi:hypothetical protein